MPLTAIGVGVGDAGVNDRDRVRKKVRDGNDESSNTMIEQQRIFGIETYDRLIS